MGKHTVRFEVFKGSEALGDITLVNGLVMLARDRQGDGKAAFQRLALVQGGTANYLAPQPNLDGLTALGSVEALLLDAFQLSETKIHHKKAAAQGPTESPAEPKKVRPQPPKPRRGPPPLPITKLAPEPAKPSKPVKTSIPVMDMDMLQSHSAILEKIIEDHQECENGAIADHDGTVQHIVGEIDADVLCAVVAMAARQLQNVTTDLGLEELKAWCFVTDHSSWFVVPTSKSFVVVCAKPPKVPAVLMGRICTRFAEGA